VAAEVADERAAAALRKKAHDDDDDTSDDERDGGSRRMSLGRRQSRAPAAAPPKMPHQNTPPPKLAWSELSTSGSRPPPLCRHALVPAGSRHLALIGGRLLASGLTSAYNASTYLFDATSFSYTMLRDEGVPAEPWLPRVETRRGAADADGERAAPILTFGPGATPREQSAVATLPVHTQASCCVLVFGGLAPVTGGGKRVLLTGVDTLHANASRWLPQQDALANCPRGYLERRAHKCTPVSSCAVFVSGGFVPHALPTGSLSASPRAAKPSTPSGGGNVPFNAPAATPPTVAEIGRRESVLVGPPSAAAACQGLVSTRSAHVTEVLPSKFDVEGGVSLTIKGRHFSPSDAILVRFTCMGATEYERAGETLAIAEATASMRQAARESSQPRRSVYDEVSSAVLSGLERTCVDLSGLALT
jgi:hypothetical protein